MTISRSVPMSSGRAGRGMRTAGVAPLGVATGIHVYEYFGANPVSLAALFLTSAAGTFIGAGLLLTRASQLGWLIGGGVSLLTFVAYCLTRTVGIPGVDPSDDIGNWSEPLGVVALVVEAIAFVLAMIALGGRSRRTP